jgi:hypothetical protein
VVRSLALPDVVRTFDFGRTERAGTHLMLRIERYRVLTGSPPESLEALAAADPTVDLIDPMTGNPFRYRLLEGDPAGRPYLLYADGSDGVDDGGVIHPEGNFKGLRDDATGADFIVNPPPEAPEWR